jgi:hypothetical protein
MLKTIRFEGPTSIPIAMYINSSCWNNYPQEQLLELILKHPKLFPDFEVPELPYKPQVYGYCDSSKPHTDGWGSVWHTEMDGIVGAVMKHALSSYDDFENFRAPDPDVNDGHHRIDWPKLRKDVTQASENGDFTALSLRHGHTFLTLIDIRGYENALFDLMDHRPEVKKLLQIIEDFNMAIIERILELPVDMVGYPEDLGMQVGPMLSPELLHEYIYPSFKRLMKPARDAGKLIHMHSDGDIRTLMDDLLAAGVDVINLQDQVNGLEWIRDNLKGKVCIDLDIDRQNVTRFGTPSEAGDLIHREVEMLNSPQGGLMLKYGMYPGIPLENADAIMTAMEEYAG